MSSYTLGESRGKIVIETDLNGIDKAKKAMESFDKTAAGSMSNSAFSISEASNMALGAGTKIASGFASAISAASDFEFQMDAIQAVSGATASEMDLINDAALRIGSETAFSASEAAVAMEELVKAGLSVSDVLGGAADATVALAAAGGVDMPTAATLAANAMNQFGLAASDLVAVSDTIAGAANASAIDVNQFGQSLSAVGAVANLVGLSFDDTALAIAAMGNAGIVGSDAGTSLKAMLTNLNPSTKKATELMRELGLITEDGANQFYTSEGSMKSLADVSDVLGGALDGMTDAQKQATLTTLFGSDAIRAASIVANTGSEGFNKLSESMHSVSAADVAKARMDNLKGAMDGLSGAVETVQIMVGQRLIPMLTDLVQAATAVVNGFASLDAGSQAIILGLVAAVGAALLLGGAFGKLLVFGNAVRESMLLMTGATTLFGNAGVLAAAKTKILAAATTLLNKAMALNPILIVVSLIALLVAGLITLAGGWDQVRAAFAPVMEALRQAAEKLMPVFQQLADTVVSSLVKALEAFLPLLVELAEQLFPPLLEVIEAVVPVIALLAGIIGDVLVEVVKLLIPLIEEIANLFVALAPAIGPVIDILSAILIPVMEALVNGLRFVADGLKVFSNMLNGNPLMEGVDSTGAFAVAISWLGDTLQAIGRVFKDVWNGIQDVVGAVVGWFSANVWPVMEQSINGLVAVMTFLWTAASVVWGGILQVVSSFVSWFAAYVAPVIGAAINLMVTLFTFLWNTSIAVWQGILSAVLAVVNWFATYVAPVIGAAIALIATVFTFLWNTAILVWQGIMATILAVVDWFMAYVAPVIGAAIALVIAVFMFFWNTAILVWTAVWTLIQTVVDWFMTYVAPVIAAAINLVVAIFMFFWNTTVAVWSAIMAAVGAVVDWFMSYVAPVIIAAINLVAAIFNFILGVAGAVWNGIMAVVGAVVNWFMSYVAPVIVNAINIAMSIMQALWGVVSSVWSQIMSFIGDVVRSVSSFISSVWGALVGIVSGIFEAVYDAISGPMESAKSIFSGFQDFVVGAFSGAGSWLVDIGGMIIGGLISGIQNALGGLTGLLNDITAMIPANKGPENVDKKLLTPAGEFIMQGLMNGISREIPELMKMLNGMNVTIPAALKGDLLNASGSLYIDNNGETRDERAALNQTIHITTPEDGRIAARVIARETQDVLEGM